MDLRIDKFVNAFTLRHFIRYSVGVAGIVKLFFGDSIFSFDIDNNN